MTQEQQAASITSKAAQFMNSMGKKELARLARANGWRGDDARTPMLQLALYCASKGLSAQQSETTGELSHGAHGSQQGKEQQGDGQQQGEQGEQSKGEQGEQSKGEQGEQSKGKQGEQGEQPKGKPMQSKFVGKCAACDGMIPEGAQILFDATAPKGKRVRHAPKCPDGKGEQGEQGEQGKGEQGEQSKGEQGQGEQPEQPQQAPNNKEWQKMLDAAGISRPHPMLRKVHALAVVARLHVMLVGPAGCGKTMLAEQLARLLGYSFSMNSMTAGTSESAMTGWLLPVGEDGRFEYVPAPLVLAVKNGRTVHLLDEADAADANLLLVMNALLANGHFPVPHNLREPMVKKADSCIILAACNTTGAGADDLYTSRTALDAATLDRFYMIRVDYAADYEATLFVDGDAPKARQWAPRADKPTAEDYRTAHAWLVELRRKVNQLKIPRIVSTRMFQKVRAALDAGITFKELKADLLMAWSPDELRRAQESI